MLHYAKVRHFPPQGGGEPLRIAFYLELRFKWCWRTMPQGEKKMRNKANVIVIGLIALLTVATAYAQPFGTMRVSVPFQFLAGDKVMPAGEYQIEIDPLFQRMALRAAMAVLECT
jgi:hypothetical protein